MIRIARMTRIQFRVLYREFLFRVVDRELLSTYAQGDMSQLLLRFVSLLIFFGLVYALPAANVARTTPPQDVLLFTWNTIDSLLAMTMLSVGLFAILSWNTMFPDRLDALVLTPLPVRPRTVFLAKIAAVATGLGVAVVSLHAAPSVLWPLRLQSVMSTDTTFTVLGIVVTPEAHAFGAIRFFFAYWITMIAAGLFIACLVIGLQGLAATLLPRPAFLRASSYLQLATFVVIITSYFLLPAGVTKATIAAASASASQQQSPLALLTLPPWYWFLAMFQQLSGTPQIGPIAHYAWWAVGVTASWTGVAYTLSYFRMIRRIAEESDIAPRSRAGFPLPRVGTARQTAIAHFSVRTLMRSSQHRIILAFYWGIGFAITTMFLTLSNRGLRRSPMTVDSLWHERSVPLIISSVVMLMTAVLGARVVLALPRDLRANWIFRITPLRGGLEYLGARRRALFALSVLPVWMLAAAVFLTVWPTLPAVGHLLVIWLLGSTLVELYLYGTRKIPFTCSYLPGKSTFRAAFWVAVLFLLMLTSLFSFIERRALDSPVGYTFFVGAIGIAWLSARVVTSMQATGTDTDTGPQFEEEPADRIVSLDVWDHRFPAPARKNVSVGTASHGT
jgi:hypothetical protein